MTNKHRAADEVGTSLDPKIAADWAVVEARRAELNSRAGGDSRRRAILRRLGLAKHAP
jgi:hypothetical protein